MKSIFTSFLFLLSSSLAFSQPSCDFDSTFNVTGKMVADGSRLGEHILIQADGKILVACNPFGNGSVYIKRFNDDGSVDGSYGSGGTFTLAVAEVATRISCMKLYNNNVYVCGTTTTNIGGTNTYPFAAAISQGGALIAGFGTGGIKKFDAAPNLYTAESLVLDSNGNIYMCGIEWLDNAFVLKMNNTGTMDATFDTDGIAYIPTNNTDHWIEANDIVLDASNNVLITGKKYKANNGSPIPAFWNLLAARFLPNGSLDATFATGGVGYFNSAIGNFDEGVRIFSLASGKCIITGNVYDNVDYDYTALRLNSNGTLDNTFGTLGWSVNDLILTNDMEYSLNSEIYPDGRILITGNQGDGDTVYFAMLMLDADGARDNTFGPNGLFSNIFNQNNNSSSSGMAVYPDGKIILAGYTRTCTGGNCGPLSMALSRYKSVVDETEGIEEDAFAESVLLFPNPAQSGDEIHFVIPNSEQIQNIEIFDQQGKNISAFVRQSKSNFILPELSKGIYFCKLTTSDEIMVKKIVVR